MSKTLPPQTRRRRRQIVLTLAALVAALVIALGLDLIREHRGREITVWATPESLRAPDSARPTRPTLLRFTADWCIPCQTMKRQVFSRPDIADTIAANYRAVSVDLTNPSAAAARLAKTYGINPIPCFVILQSDGREAARLVGGVTPDTFRRFLNRYARYALDAPTN